MAVYVFLQWHKRESQMDEMVFLCVLRGTPGFVRDPAASFAWKYQYDCWMRDFGGNFLIGKKRQDTVQNRYIV